MSLHSLISIWAYASIFIIEITVYIWAIVEGAVSPLHGSASPLVHKVPVEAGEGAVLVTLVLEKGFALLHTKLLQVPV